MRNLSSKKESYTYNSPNSESRGMGDRNQLSSRLNEVFQYPYKPDIRRFVSNTISVKKLRKRLCYQN